MCVCVCERAGEGEWGGAMVGLKMVGDVNTMLFFAVVCVFTDFTFMSWTWLTRGLWCVYGFVCVCVCEGLKSWMFQTFYRCCIKRLLLLVLFIELWCPLVTNVVKSTQKPHFRKVKDFVFKMLLWLKLYINVTWGKVLYNLVLGKK